VRARKSSGPTPKYERPICRRMTWPDISRRSACGPECRSSPLSQWIEVVVSSRRTLILIGALVAGAVAALLIFQYVGGIEEKAQGDAQMVDVVIAKAPITKGAAANDLIAAQAIDIGQRRQVDLPANR